MGDRLSKSQRCLHRSGGLGQGLPAKIAIKFAKILCLGLFKQALREEIAKRCVVLMQRVHRHTVGGRASRLGQALAKRVVRLVGDADPIDSAKHYRLCLAKQHHAPATQRHRVQPHHRVVGHHVANRRRGIDIKRGHPQRLSRRTEHPQRRRKQNRQRQPDGTPEN